MLPRRVLLAAGLLAPLWFAVVVLVLGSLRPGYDHARDVLSRLGESGYALGWAMNALGFGALALGIVLFALGLRSAFPTPRGRWGSALLALAGLAIAAVGALPCDAGCREVSALGRFHSPAASVAATAMFAALLLFLLEFRDRREWQAHARLTMLLAVPALLGGLLYVLRVEPWIGAWQRLALAGPMLWMMLTAWRLLTADGAAPVRGSSP